MDAQCAKVVFSAVLLCCFMQLGDAVKCYECTSANNSACLDMVTYGRTDLIPMVDCNKALGSLPKITSNKFFCRKIIQSIMRPNRDTEVRVTRGCGWMASARACYKADTDDHLETVCQCYADGCNGAPPRIPAAHFIISLVLTALLPFTTSSLLNSS